MIVKNISNQSQMICGVPGFLAGETREVDKDLGLSLLKNSNFIEITPEKTSKKK